MSKRELVGHIGVDGKAGDESHQFERSLDSIAAKLAIKLL
jgi:hypothetical protein